MNRVSIKPDLLLWAYERASLNPGALEVRFPKLEEWLSGALQPTLRQLEAFAHAVHVPIGYLFLPAPPEEKVPIPDFRTMRDRPLPRPSPNLLDTIYLCQQRQDWFRDYARMHKMAPVAFIGSVSVRNNPVTAADSMRGELGLSVADRQKLDTWTEALRQLIAKAEEIGVLVMGSSIVGSNPYRSLDVEEFRGFALTEDLAPLIFTNAADSKSAQMFTLAHELAHLWLGESGLSNPEAGILPDQEVERWCNAVAAEVLAPITDVRREFRSSAVITDEIQRMARIFKVSSLVVLRRLFDAGFINQNELWRTYEEELERIRSLDRRRSSGGDFYRTLRTRTGKRFARAVIASALEGQTLFKDAFRMLGVRKTATFYEAAREFGVM